MILDWVQGLFIGTLIVGVIVLIIYAIKCVRDTGKV